MTDPVQVPDLAAFAGVWQLTRRIDDSLGQPGRFIGIARFDPVSQGLAYSEQGLLQLGDAPAFKAERRNVWAADGQGITVAFADGRPFHRFDPSQSPAKAHHDCAPDLYLVSYDFGHWPLWQVEWRVTGPRKDYRMVSDYRR